MTSWRMRYSAYPLYACWSTGGSVFSGFGTVLHICASSTSDAYSSMTMTWMGNFLLAQSGMSYHDCHAFSAHAFARSPCSISQTRWFRQPAAWTMDSQPQYLTHGRHQK